MLALHLNTLLATELPPFARPLFRFYAKATYTAPAILELGYLVGPYWCSRFTECR